MERGQTLRADKFLYFARLAKSRSRAQALLAEGSPRLDGRPLGSAHADLRPGQTLTLVDHGRLRAIEIIALPHRRGPGPEARACYIDRLAPTPIDEAAASP